MKEWTKHWGDDGILADAGMISLSMAERQKMMDRMKDLPALKKDDLN
jgi:phosphate transport system substrate-binding protein